MASIKSNNILCLTIFFVTLWDILLVNGIGCFQGDICQQTNSNYANLTDCLSHAPWQCPSGNFCRIQKHDRHIEALCEPNIDNHLETCLFHSEYNKGCTLSWDETENHKSGPMGPDTCLFCVTNSSRPSNVQPPQSVSSR